MTSASSAPASAASPWFAVAGPPSAAVRLVCLPWGGGSPRAYLDWQGPLSGVADVHAVQVPGRGPRAGEPAAGSIAELADGVTAAVLADPRPVVVFGHSLGAVLGFEVARRLAGSPLAHHLVASGSAAPAGLPDAYLTWAAGLDRPALAAMAHRYEGLPEAIVDDADLQDLLMPDLEADLRLIAGYRYSADGPLRCGVTLTNGRDDWHVAGPALDGWDAECEAPPERRWFDGDHFYLTRSPELLEALAALAAGVAADVHVEVI